MLTDNLETQDGGRGSDLASPNQTEKGFEGLRKAEAAQIPSLMSRNEVEHLNKMGI